MKFKFNPNQEFQLDAINSIVDIFEGQTNTESRGDYSNELLGIYANQINLSNEEILANSKKVQLNNKINNGQTSDDLDFSVEMETGTGKTYVYLRTIFELNKKYGWKKFIILVPSIAIKEGVLKTLKITKEHFKDIYGNAPYRFYEYDSKKITQVRHFALSNNIEIMVMTIGSFNSDDRVLYSTRDQMQGEQPMSYIQKTNPILILDEPQNMEGEATKEKLKNFNSAFRLRYSATHRNYYNLVYQLTPYDAYQLGLVKRIEVLSITDDDSSNLGNAFMRLIDVSSVKSSIKAKLEVLVKDSDGNYKKKSITVTQRDDLVKKTNNSAYEGYVAEALTVNAPDFGSVGSIRFSNNVEVLQNENTATDKEDIFRKQIEETIKIHFEKRRRYRELGIKVLSLIFIDKVDNYVGENGIIRQLFKEIFESSKKEFGFDDLDTEKVHKGYFAMRNNEYLTRESSIEQNKEAYELIMKDKERLLSFEEPTEFIFSHSALKEGWDSPNIFNICTLNETTSTMKKRQEIGRGMRLSVNQDGERIFQKQVNLLTVIANESYANYVSQLQSEFIEDGIYKAPPSPSNAKKKTLVKLKRGFEQDKNFSNLWERISQKTKYKVQVNEKNLIEECSKQIAKLSIPKPQWRVDRAGLDINSEGIDSRLLGTDEGLVSQKAKIIDSVSFIKNETKLTRNTVAEILEKSDNIKSFLNNPERFIFEAVRIIKSELIRDFISQISYEILPDKYKTEQFENISSYKDSVQSVDNSIYDAVVFDSDVEKKFALDLDKDERIKLFIKLPNWYKVETPLGGYNPDWAIVTSKIDLSGKEIGEKTYFVVETKGNIEELRPAEKGKIESAKKHFEVIDVSYKEVDSYEKFEQEVLR